MKKLVFAFLLFTNVICVTSQSWIDFGVKAQWGPNLLLNSSIFDDGSYNHQLKTAGGFGAKIGYNFNDMHEVTFDFMASKFKQDFVYTISDTSDNSQATFNSGIEYKSLDFMLLYRNNKEGRYFEIGPLISKVRSASRFDDAIPNGNDNNFDLDKVVPIQTGAILGFGSYIMGTDNFGVTAGVRISYLFTDLISANGKLAGYPQGINYNATEPGTSHPLLVELIFEANFDLAYMAKAQCGRTKILMFN